MGESQANLSSQKSTNLRCVIGHFILRIGLIVFRTEIRLNSACLFLAHLWRKIYLSQRVGFLVISIDAVIFTKMARSRVVLRSEDSSTSRSVCDCVVVSLILIVYETGFVFLASLRFLKSVVVNICFRLYRRSVLTAWSPLLCFLAFDDRPDLSWWVNRSKLRRRSPHRLRCAFGIQFLACLMANFFLFLVLLFAIS